MTSANFCVILKMFGRGSRNLQNERKFSMMANDLMRRNDWLNDPFFNDLGRHIFDSFTPTRVVDNSRLM